MRKESNKFLLYFLIVLFIVGLGTANAVLITFDEYIFSEGEKITNWYAGMGVMFSGTTTDTPPVIAQPNTGVTYGFVLNSGTDDHPLSTNISGKNMLTDYAGLGGLGWGIGHDIKATFSHTSNSSKFLCN